MLQIINCIYLHAHYVKCVNLYPKQKFGPFLQLSLRIMLAHTFYTFSHQTVAFIAKRPKFDPTNINIC